MSAEFVIRKLIILFNSRTYVFTFRRREYAKKYFKTFLFYRKAIELHPIYDQAMNNLANILRDLEQLDEAKYLLLKAVELRYS